LILSGAVPTSSKSLTRWDSVKMPQPAGKTENQKVDDEFSNLQLTQRLAQPQ
jgi:hypothetical protein